MATMRRRRTRTSAPSSTFVSLHIRNYRLFFAGQIISTSGTWMQTVAQGWLVLRLSHSGTDLGLITAARFLPMMLFSPWGGLIADRLDKRRILYVTQTLAGLLALVLLAALVADHVITLWMVAAIALTLGFVNVFDNPTRQSFIAEMVPDEDLGNAITLNSVTINMARVIGPALAGVLIATVGIAPCFVANAASFGAVLISLVMMRPRELYPVARPTRQPGQVREGLRYVRRTPELLVPLIMITVVGTLAWEFQVSLPLMARYAFHGSAATYGTMLAFMGAGAVVGGLVTARRGRLSASGWAARRSAGAWPSWPRRSPPTCRPSTASCSWSATAASASTRWPRPRCSWPRCPSMRGRVMALWSVAWLGSTPIGGPIVGWIGQSFGARWTLVVGGLAAVAAGLLGYASLKRIDQRALASSSAGSGDIGPEPESSTEVPAAVQVATQFEP
jgi:MFS family permease